MRKFKLKMDQMMQSLNIQERTKNHRLAKNKFFHFPEMLKFSFVLLVAIACGNHLAMTKSSDYSNTSQHHPSDQSKDLAPNQGGESSEVEIAACAESSLIKGKSVKENLSVRKLGNSISITYRYDVMGSSQASKGEQRIVGVLDGTYRNVMTKDELAILIEKAEMTLVHNGVETHKFLDKTEISLSSGRIIIEEWEPILILKNCKIAKN